MKFKYTVEPGSTKQQWKVLENGDLIAICQNEPNAITLIGMLNEYDTLKVKADMLDRLTELQNSTEFGNELLVCGLLAHIKGLKQ